MASQEAAVLAVGGAGIYEPGFEGWDISYAGTITDYLILLTGLFCTLLLCRAHRPTWRSLECLSAACAAFLTLEGLTYGTGGLTHHMLAAYKQAGGVMSKTWGVDNWGWMVPWTLAMTLAPLGTAVGLGTSLSYAKLGTSCTKYAVLFGVLVACWECRVCIVSVDASGAAGFFWALLCAVVGLGLTLRFGAGTVDVWMQALGWVARIVGYLVLLTVPASCTGGAAIEIEAVNPAHEEVEAACIYSKDFNHNAIYHMLIVLSLVLIYASVDSRMVRDLKTVGGDDVRALKVNAFTVELPCGA